MRVEGEIHAAGVGQLERRGQAGLGFTNSVPIKRFVQKMQDKSVKTMNGFKELKALDVIETVS